MRSKRNLDNLSLEIVEKFEEPFSVGGRGYIGLEASGGLTLGNVASLFYFSRVAEDRGARMIVLVSDIHASLNLKERVEENSQRLKESILSIPFLRGAEVVLLSEIVNKEYFMRFLRMMSLVNFNDIVRSLTITGRSVDSYRSNPQILLYPLLQCNDIVELDVDFVCAGVDQRKVHMLYKDRLVEKFGRKVSFYHFRILPSLRDPTKKMSKSVPNSAILLDDSPDLIRKKVHKAFFPEDAPLSSPLYLIWRLIRCSKELSFDERTYLLETENGAKVFKEHFADEIIEFVHLMAGKGSEEFIY